MKQNAKKMQTSSSDLVNKPSHYNQAGIECIEAIRAALGPEGFSYYCQGNSMKYLWRFRYKNRGAGLCRSAGSTQLAYRGDGQVMHYCTDFRYDLKRGQEAEGGWGDFLGAIQ